MIRLVALNSSAQDDDSDCCCPNRVSRTLPLWGKAKGSLRLAKGSLCFSPSGLGRGGSATEKQERAIG